MPLLLPSTRPVVLFMPRFSFSMPFATTLFTSPLTLDLNEFDLRSLLLLAFLWPKKRRLIILDPEFLSPFVLDDANEGLLPL